MTDYVRSRRGFACGGALIVGVLLSGTLLVTPASAWQARGSGSRVYAETASRSPGSRLRLSCEETVKLYLYPPRGWDGNNLDPTLLEIDGNAVSVMVDPVDDGVILSDRSDNGVGITARLRARMKGGDTLVISGPATARIPAGQVTFSLNDAAPAISSFERNCPAARGT